MLFLGSHCWLATSSFFVIASSLSREAVVCRGWWKDARVARLCHGRTHGTGCQIPLVGYRLRTHTAHVSSGVWTIQCVCFRKHGFLVLRPTLIHIRGVGAFCIMQIVCTQRPLAFALRRTSARKSLAIDLGLCAYGS